MSLLPAACAVGDEAAHGSSGYAGAVLYLLHSEARRRLPAVKRTATMPGRVGHKTQVSSLCSTAHRRSGVNRYAIEHNRALPKAGQSLRRASLGGLPLSRPAGSGNGRLCLAPQPGQRLFRRRYRGVVFFWRFVWVVWFASAPEGAGAGRRCRWSV
jgi:hypothetical protein